jgi:urease accessory protein
MLRIEHVLGSRIDVDLAERLHRLEHQGAVDVVTIPAVDLARRRLLIATHRGEELAIALPRNERLFDGAVLLLEADRAIVVRAATERWLRLEPRAISDAVELGYHVGNLHWRVRFAGEVLLVALEGRPEDYTARLENLITARRVGVTVLDEDAADTADAQEPSAAADGPVPHPHHHEH